MDHIWCLPLCCCYTPCIEFVLHSVIPFSVMSSGLEVYFDDVIFAVVVVVVVVVIIDLLTLCEVQ